MNKKILLLFLPLLALACSLTITKPAAQIGEPLPTKSPTLPGAGIPAYTATASVETCKVTADALNLRDTPTIEGDVIAWLYVGDVLTILPDQPVENWIFVQAEKLTGWINSNYCER